MESHGEEMKQITMRHNGITGSFFLSHGFQNRASLEKCIKTVLKLHDPMESVIGISETDIEGAPLIPLEVLEQSNRIVDSNKIYSPCFWEPQVSGTEGVSDELVQHFQSSSLETQNEDTQPPVYSDNQVHHHLDATSPSTDPSAPQEPSAQDQPATNYNYSGGYDANDPWQNYEYFHQYGKLTIHNEMLKDSYRTETYRQAIMNHKKEIEGKVVLDLGTGTGILAFFCVQAGASKVYAVEASDLADWTELIVAANGLQDRIQVVKGRIEDITLPEKVDVIVSEWMGTFLIFESMLESLLWTRDQLLKPNGFLLPSHSSIFFAPVTMEDFYQEKVNFWHSVYDVDMSVLMPFAKKCAFERPIIDHQLKPENVLAEPILVRNFDLGDVPIEQPYEKTIINFSFKASKDANLHGFAGWFDTLFGAAEDKKNHVTLSTSPDQKSTHWHQLLLMFDNPVPVKKGYTIKGTLRYQRNPDLLRHLIFDVSFAVEELSGEAHTKRFYLWGTE